MKTIEVKLTEKEMGEILWALGSDPDANERLIAKLNRAKGKKPIITASRKAKGRELQYRTCQMIADCVGVEFDQSDPDCPIHSNEMGQKGVDIILRGDVRRKFPFAVECKSQEKFKMNEWIAQAKYNAERSGVDWMLVFRNKVLKEPVVAMNFEKFLIFFKKCIKV